MNKKGWGLPEMIILSSIIIMALLIACLNIKKLDNDINRINSNSEKNEEEKNKTNYNNTNSSKDDSNTDINNNVDTNKDIVNDIAKYLSIETQMVDSATEYIDNNYIISSQDTVIVDKIHLIEQDHELENNMSTYNCNGYVRVVSDGTSNYYTPFLKCDSYTTSGYNENYNN